ncbi:MAG: transglutaminase-like cysteine peptidase [Candidatus Undinarchaeales archaeon]|jgi:transglutaminase-like putative cysteine protease|nr:transglutaminase-like cysteine peptidase [Candidatus Undinarchaeales archaeon]
MSKDSPFTTTRGGVDCPYEVFLKPHETAGILNEALPERTSLKADIGRAMMYVNRRIAYVSDLDNFGKKDYWQYPRETLASGKGDCEDMALLLASLLIEAGIKGVRVVVGNYEHEPHAWVEVKGRRATFILDSSFGKIYTTPMGSYVPHCYVDMEGSTSAFKKMKVVKINVNVGRVFMLLCIGLGIWLFIRGSFFVGFILIGFSSLVLYQLGTATE